MDCKKMTFVLQTLTVPVLLKAVVQIPTRPAARVKALNQAQTAIWVNPPAARVLVPSRTH